MFPWPYYGVFVWSISMINIAYSRLSITKMNANLSSENNINRKYCKRANDGCKQSRDIVDECDNFNHILIFKKGIIYTT